MDKKQLMLLLGALGTLAGCDNSSSVASSGDPGKEALQQMLDKLAETPAIGINVRATCYMMIIPEEKIFEYKCPNCGKTTLYRDFGGTLKSASYSEEDDNPEHNKKDNSVEVWDLESRRLAIERLEEAAEQWGLSFSLDESNYCVHCRKGKLGEEKLKVIHSDGSTHESIATEEDISLLTAFFQRRVYFNSNERTKDKIDRIQFLLGLAPKKYEILNKDEEREKVEKESQSFLSVVGFRSIIMGDFENTLFMEDEEAEEYKAKIEKTAGEQKATEKETGNKIEK